MTTIDKILEELEPIKDKVVINPLSKKEIHLIQSKFKKRLPDYYVEFLGKIGLKQDLIWGLNDNISKFKDLGEFIPSENYFRFGDNGGEDYWLLKFDDEKDRTIYEYLYYNDGEIKSLNKTFDELIKEIASIVPPKISSFLLTSETTTTKIIEHHKKVNTTTIQIVDKLTNGNYEDLRIKLPEIDIVQVIHVIGKESIIQAKEIAPFVDYLLLDSGNPNLKVKVLGGTGKIHNWEISKRIRESVQIPVFLAGGLNSENIIDAINKVRPFGVDLCSGLRTNGELDERKLKSFFDAVKNS